MTAEPKYGPWIAWNATPDSTCPPDAVGKWGQVHLAYQTRDVALSSHPTQMGDWDWQQTNDFGIIAYRVLIEPVRGELILTGALEHAPDGLATFGAEAWATDTHRLTLPTLDGALIPGTYIGPDGAVVVVEVL